MVKCLPGRHKCLPVPPLAVPQCPSSAPAPPRGAPHGSGWLNTPRWGGSRATALQSCRFHSLSIPPPDDPTASAVQAWLPKSDNPFEELVTPPPTSPPPLDVTVLVQQRSTDAVAHFLTFSVRHEAVRGQLAGYTSSSRPVPSEGEEDTFRVLADTTLYPTAAGCGMATVDAQGVRSRTESPWLTNMVDTFPAGLETLITGFRLEVCPLLRCMLSYLRTCVPTHSFTCSPICLFGYLHLLTGDLLTSCLPTPQGLPAAAALHQRRGGWPTRPQPRAAALGPHLWRRHARRRRGRRGARGRAAALRQGGALHVRPPRLGLRAPRHTTPGAFACRSSHTPMFCVSFTVLLMLFQHMTRPHWPRRARPAAHRAPCARGVLGISHSLSLSLSRPPQPRPALCTLTCTIKNKHDSAQTTRTSP